MEPDAAHVDVRPLSEADRPVWEELFRGYNEFYERELTDAVADSAWSRLLQDVQIHGLGAWLDGRLVGITHFMVHPSTTAADVCYLQDLFTAPDVRGRGVGRALIAAVCDWARARDLSRVYWTTHDTNATARVLYDAVGTNRGFIRYEIDL